MDARLNKMGFKMDIRYSLIIDADTLNSITQTLDNNCDYTQTQKLRDRILINIASGLAVLLNDKK